MKNKILIYDDNCPLCTWYSGLFVKYGFLDTEGRKAFSTLDADTILKIDFDRSRNEIPLLDASSNKVLYGIDALLEILDQKIPLIKKTGNLSGLNWFLKKLYKLVSYNRKVLVAKRCGAGSIDCSPDINYKYRLLLLAIGLVFNTLMLYPVHYNLLTHLSYYHLNYIELQAAHFAFVIVNCSLAFHFSKVQAIEYLGQVNMLALSAILLLLPFALINVFINPEWLNTLWLIGSAIFIFKEYIRRMEYAGILQKKKWIVSMNLLSLTIFIAFLFH